MASATVPPLRPTASVKSVASCRTSTITANGLFLATIPLRFYCSYTSHRHFRKRCALAAFAAASSERAQQQEEEEFGWLNGATTEELQDLEKSRKVGDAAPVGGDPITPPGTKLTPPGTSLFMANLPPNLDRSGLAGIFSRTGTVDVAENLNGRIIYVCKATSDGCRPSSTLPSLYVGNLPWHVDDVQLFKMFSKHGKVVSARIARKQDTGYSRGFGFVVMSTQTESECAVAALNGTDLDGRNIEVEIARIQTRIVY